MISRDLQRKMLRMLDGDLPAEEAAALEASLVADPEARAEWWRLSRLHSALEIRYAAEATIRRSPVVPVERVLALRQRRIVRTALSATAAAILLGAVALWLVNAPPPPPAAVVRAAPESVFTTAHTGDRKNGDPGTLGEGSVLTLEHGVAELDLPHDVRAVVQAPAVLALTGPREVRLDHGRAFFEVASEAGHGFTVATPRQRIVDLGTSFGVVALRDGTPSTDLHVFDGTVRVDGPDGLAGEIIRAGRAVRLEGTTVAGEIEPSAASFLRELPERVDLLLHDEFSNGLAADSQFAVLIDPGAILGESGRAFPGITENDGWSFRTTSAAPADIPVRNPAFGEDGRETSHGDAIAGWHDARPDEWGWGVVARRNNLTPTEGRFFGRLFPGNTLRQTTGEKIRPGVTYVLTLDVGLSNSTAVVRLLDSGSGDVLAETTFTTPGEKWLRDQSLLFTAAADHASGGRLAISLACESGAFAAFDRIRFGTAGHDAGAGFDPAAVPAPPATDEPGPAPHAPPRITAMLPAAHDDAAVPGGPLMLRFDQPIEWGRGRITLRNITDWSETVFIAGADSCMSIDGPVLTIRPPLELADGRVRMGRVPGWESAGWTGLRQPPTPPRHPGPPPAPVATLDASVPATAIRRAVGTVAAGRTYTAGVAIRRGSPHESASGYRVRFISGSTVLAESNGRIPPGRPGSGLSAALAWHADVLPAGIAPDDPLVLEIAPGPDARDGRLDIDNVRVTAVDPPDG